VLAKPVKTKETLDGVFAEIRKFLDKSHRTLLVVEADDQRRAGLVELLRDDGVDALAVGTAADALALVSAQPIDLIVMEFSQPGSRGLDLIDEIKEATGARDLPVIVFTERALSKKEEMQLKRMTQTAVVKDVRSRERLLDEVAMFLHRPVSKMPPERQEILSRLHDSDAIVAGKKVLIVDDDIRNIFAMTSILEPHKMQILSAETGKGAISTLEQTADVDLVLMDIMMPDMDGYDTMRAIRRMSRFQTLPIIALTAKAMKGDREKCIEAGASDYIAKPVDSAQLLALIRMWLHR